jgi:hypothetical protein
VLLPLAVLLLLVAAVAIVLLRRRIGRDKKGRPDESTQDTLKRLGIARDEKEQRKKVKRAASGSGLTATELLGITEKLRVANALWPAIVVAINPKSDAVIERILRDIRAPHQFAPHVALNAIEDGCRRVLAGDASATATDALREALRRTSEIVGRGS